MKFIDTTFCTDKAVDAMKRLVLPLIVMSLCALSYLGNPVYADPPTVVTLNQYALLPSMEEVEKRSCCVVDVTVIQTYDNRFAIYTAPQLTPSINLSAADRVRKEWKKMPHVVSGPETATINGAQSLSEKNLAWAIVSQEVVIDKVHKGEIKPGQKILVEQPGSVEHDVVAQGMPLMVPGQRYRLYLSPAEYYEQGLPVHTISGLNAGLLRIHGDEVFHELANSTEVKGRVDR